jgi:hypothetical protein
MRSIWMSRLSRTSTIAAIAGLAIVAGGAAAEARWDGYYYDGWGYQQYYSRPAWTNNYYYAPGYSYYSPPAYTYYGRPYYGPSYYGPSFSLTVPLR